MCLTVPAKIIKVEGTRALIEDGKGERYLELSAVPGVKAGDWVLHVNGLVIKTIPTEDALEIIGLLEGVKKPVHSFKSSPYNVVNQ